MPMEKTYHPAEAEARIAALWDTANAFRAGANAAPGAPVFSVMIPPPNVTGSLHIGHAFNNTLQDILVRWHRMQGHDTLWQVGTDHAGIATQMVTEREMAKTGAPTRREMGREAFTARVWQQKQASRGTIIGQLKRLGASCDWSREAFTMSGAPDAPAGEEGNFHDAVIKVFVDMYAKGLIYRGKRLVNWDPHFETAISDLEVENIEVPGHMWHFKYRLAGGDTYDYVERDEGGGVTFREVRDYISIATTRPETMLGDGAVAVHPSDTRYAPIVGKMVHLPLCDRLIPIITDDYPDPLFGSGAVKITGAHDFNDYAVAMRHNIPLYPLMDTKGDMRTDDSPDNMVPAKYRGLHRFRRDGVDGAREAIVADITAAGLAVTVLVKSLDEDTGSEHLTLEPVVESKKIMQPFGDRSKVVIEPMLTDQWFVDTAKIVGPALEAVRSGATKIIPPSGEKIYYHWLENIEPWCISRQLWWGHQIPVWYGPKVEIGEEDRLRLSFMVVQDRQNVARMANERFCATDLPHAISLARERYAGRNVIEVADEHSFLEAFDAWARGNSESIPIYRDPDVLDTWFSSGLWPIGTLGWPEQTPELARYFPTSTLITGADILFFWVARMMMMQLAVVGEIPFHTVYLHGLVRDAKGKKMSKSLGNVVDPLDVIDEYGADALRFGNAAMASLGGVLKLDTQRIAGYRNFGTKLLNAARFAEMNGVWDGHATSAPPNPRATVNRWIIGEAAKTRAEVDTALADFRFDQAASALYSFIWGRVCDWYVEFAKPLFDGPDAAETRQTMAWVLDQCMILLHPISPFLTEELWQTTGAREKLLCHTDWPTYGSEFIDADADRELTWVTTLIDDIRSARAQMHVPVGLKLDMLALAMDPAATAAWSNNEALIKRLARIATLTPADQAPKGAITVPAIGAAFAIPLAGIIDIAAEQARLQKTLDKLDKEINGLQGRLNNPNFAASAPEDVVVEAKANLEARQDEAEKLLAALQRLKDLA
jgi:valyl-tRNA synthetase